MNRLWILPALFLIEAALFSLVGGARLDSPGAIALYLRSYFSDMFAQSAPVLVLGWAMTLVIAMGGIDLSVASQVALVSCVMSLFPADGRFWWTAAPVGMATGLLLGIVNGGLIAGLGVPPIVATLGTMILFRGFCFGFLGDLEKSTFLSVPGYEWLGQFLGAAVMLALVYGVGSWWVLGSRWRREIETVGGNRIAARFGGVPVERRWLQTYGCAGLLAWVAALSFTSRNGAINASSLSGMELRVIVAVVLGGTRVQGGAISFWGTFWATLLLAGLDEGLRGASAWGDRHLPFRISHLQYVLLGGLLLGAVWLNSRADKRLAGAKPSNKPS